MVRWEVVSWGREKDGDREMEGSELREKEK